MVTRMGHNDATAVLSALSARAGLHHDFMAYVIREYMRSEDLSEESLCSSLGVTRDLLTRLSLCKRPDPQAADFLERVAAIADYTLCDEDAILQLIRHVDALDALRTTGKESMLSAARDRPEASESEADGRDKKADHGE